MSRQIVMSRELPESEGTGVVRLATQYFNTVFGRMAPLPFAGNRSRQLRGGTGGARSVRRRDSAAHLEVLRDPGQQLARARWQDLLAHVCYLLAGCLSFTQPGSHSGISVGHADELIHADVLEIVRERANGIGQFRWGCRIQARKVDIRRLQVSPGGRWPPPLPSQRNDGATSFAQNRSAARRLRNQGNGLDGNLLRRG